MCTTQLFFGQLLRIQMEVLNRLGRGEVNNLVRISSSDPLEIEIRCSDFSKVWLQRVSEYLYLRSVLGKLSMNIG